MKVGTDGVLLGAWTPIEKSTENIVDLGTGTGLIPLMLAQRSNAKIIGIEKESNASNQAKDNFANSPWPERLKSINQCIETFSKENHERFDLCTMNPPFFSNQLKSEKTERSLARHMDKIGIQTWLISAKNLIHENGKIAMIISSDCSSLWKNISLEIGLFHQTIVEVKTKPSKPASRLLILMTRKKVGLTKKSMILETNTRGIFTSEYYELVKDYYLFNTSIK